MRGKFKFRNQKLGKKKFVRETEKAEAMGEEGLALIPIVLPLGELMFSNQLGDLGISNSHYLVRDII
jgi:hypothetical protein